MKKLILPALATFAALGLAACDSSAPEATATDDAAAAEAASAAANGEPAMSGEAAATATVPAGATAVSGTGDSVTVSEDGVNAQINDGDTSVSADVDGDPAVTVKTN